MLCEEVTALLPGMVDGDLDVDPAATQHIETCLRCHADAQVNRLVDHLPWVITPPGTDPGHKHYLASCLVCHPSPEEGTDAIQEPQE